ncbi:SusC/RagA family TonB-linked outer membrane protein [Fibrella forsythiae]|uniref:SusC/RagA family TonB-linked outer membrane protein n=1 Tax=Fibrella forsythiae TaxID=2817061 RepID=A0ABS3JDJ6_9BACT|nr:SusC/RagA family TonB-linked outer membrane protein [Fibrella forsythiae]MBO0948075.1 SusC/RagA family TonB-linked outer membrane protein [Fibrella forsythiae]
MKNRYVTLSVLIGLSLYSLPQLAAAQLMTRANTSSRGATLHPDVQSDDNRSNRTRSLKKALSEIERKYHVNFAYDEQLVTGRQAEADLSGATLEQTLNQLLTGQGLRFRKIKDNLFVIQAAAADKATPTPPLANPATDRPDVVVVQATEAVVKRISGRVVDENNQGLPGANVIEKGTNNGATTDANGNFVINASDAATTLAVSSVGYTTQDVTIGDQTVINVKLVPDDRTLNEVVVIGYQTVRKKDLTGANDVISPTQANKVTANSLAESIQGLSPGVTVRNSGVPGTQASIQIRGVASFLNTDPLYIIDGMIADANPTINNDDIESIQVLKDASAAAIYGSRAANGVVIITTKQGKEGPVRVSFSGKYGGQQVYKRWNVTDAAGFAALQRTQYQNSGQTPPSSVATGTFNPNINTNWQDQVLQTGSLQDYNLSLSGGTKTSTYLISGSYFNNKGYVIGSGFDRASLRINTRNQVGRFTFGENALLTNSNIQNFPAGNPIYDMATALPVIPVQDPRYVNAANPGGYGIGTNPDAVSYSYNPVAVRNLVSNGSNFAKLVGNAYLDVKLTDWLSYRANAGLEVSFDYTQNLRRLGTYQYSASPVPTSVSEDRSRYLSLLFEHTLNFNKTFGAHSINGVVGISQQTTRRDITSGSRTNLGFSGGQYFTTINAATGISNSAGSTPDDYRILGYLGRVNYAYNDRYLLTFTGRVDQDSRFGANYRTGFFPSVAAAWRISQEKFFKADWVSDLKLNASYGKLGIVVPYLGSFPYTAFINNNPRAIFGVDQTANVGAYQAQLANPDLRWEERIQQNYGVSTSFLNNRITTEINVYNSLSNDAILNLAVPGYLGNLRGNPFVNTASIRNQGVEFSATYRNNEHPFKWDVSGNFTTIKNTVVNVGNQGQNINYIQSGNTRSQVGLPVGQWYVLKTAGIFQSQEEINNYRGPNGQLIQPNAKPGDIRYVDTNGDGQITQNDDRQFVSSPWPKLQAGAQFNASYGQFSLNVQLTGVFGYTVYNDVRRSLDTYQLTNFRRDVSPWSPTNTNTTDPRLGLEAGDQGIVSNNYGFTDRWLEDASYVRMRNVEVGYTLPRAFLDRVKVRSARVYVSAQNLFTITKYTGLDPDVTGANIQERGVDNGHWPSPRVVSVGLNCEF